MLPSFDKYSVHARLVPAFLVLLPLGLSIVSLFPDKFVGWDFIVWLGTSSGLAVLLEQLSRDQGKAKESHPLLTLGWKTDNEDVAASRVASWASDSGAVSRQVEVSYSRHEDALR